MLDRFGRSIEYLRLSVTDLCNMRCRYCMREEGVRKLPHERIMSPERIRDVVDSCAQLGIRKVRLTGGEPLVRRGILEIIRYIRTVPGIEEVDLTTNGSLLPSMAESLKDAGVDRLNISLDTTDPDLYRVLTRRGELAQVTGGIAAAKEAGFSHIKLNAVLTGEIPGIKGGSTLRTLPELIRYADEEQLELRLIELMPIGVCADWPRSSFVKMEEALPSLKDFEAEETEGVAKMYRNRKTGQRIGLIEPLSCMFCESCNRIRITADGKLKPCLHSEDEIDLNPYTGAELTDAIADAILRKPERHYLAEDMKSHAARDMNRIGG